MSNPEGKGLEEARAARSAKAAARRAGKPGLTLEDLAARCGLDVDTFISKLTELLASHPRALDRSYPMPGTKEALPAPEATASPQVSPQALEREPARVKSGIGGQSVHLSRFF